MMSFFLNLFLLIFLGIVQVSFLTTWPWPVSSINLILTLVIFLTAIVNYERALFWAAGSGLFLELYSGLPFGTTTIALVSIVIIINQLFSNFFTNRSYYSLMILGFIGSLAYNLIVLFISAVMIVANLGTFAGNADYPALFFWQPLLNLIILTIMFYAYYLSRGGLNSIFVFPVNNYEAKNQR